MIDITRMNNTEFKEFTKGRFFGIKFKTKKGDIREYKTCRTEVGKYTKGGSNNVESNKPEMVTVWPKELVDQYRTVTLPNVVEFKFQGKTYKY